MYSLNLHCLCFLYCCTFIMNYYNAHAIRCLSCTLSTNKAYDDDSNDLYNLYLETSTGAL